MGSRATAFAPPGFAVVIDRARRGDPGGFDDLWRALAPAVRGYLRLQGADEADELTNDTFLGAFRALDGFVGGEAEFRSFLFRIAHRRLIDSRRRRQRRPETVALADRFEPAGGDAEDDALRYLADERARDLLGRLTDAQRDVLLLRVLGGLSVTETAAVLGRPGTAVKALSRRGLESLRRILGEAVSE